MNASKPPRVRRETNDLLLDRPARRNGRMAWMSVLALALVGAAVTSTQAKESDVVDLTKELPFHDGITAHGTLENGMRYLVMPHQMPAGKVELMFHIHSGSLNEEEIERGLAHYLEHMAFNGSKRYPAGTLVKTFESHGMKFGRDQNAFTSFDQTTYLLSLPNAEPVTLDMCFGFFSDVGSSLTLPEKEVQKERGVILEEERMRDTAQQRMMTRILSAMGPGSRVSERFPIGLTQVIKDTDAARLRGYYSRCYRPDITTLIVLGDVDANVVEAQIKKSFGGWAKPETEMVQAVPGVSPANELSIQVMTDPDVTSCEVTHLDFRGKETVKTVGDFRETLVNQMGAGVLNRRFRQMIQRGKADFQSAQASMSAFISGERLRQVGAEGESASWKAMAEQTFTEHRRMLLHGATQDELDAIKTSLTAQTERMAAMAQSIPAGGLIRGINQSVSTGTSPMSMAQMRDLVASLMGGITVEEVSDAFRANYAMDKGLLIAVFPKKEGVTVPSDKELKAVLDSVMKADIKPSVVTKKVDSILAGLPAAGEVATKTHDAELDVTSLTFKNGVRVFLKPVAAEQTVQIQTILYGGMLHEGKTTRGLTALADAALNPGGAATQTRSAEQVSRYLEGKKVSVGRSRTGNSVTLGLSGAAGDLKPGLELVHGLLAAPKLEERVFSDARTEYLRTLRDVKTSAQQALSAEARSLFGSRAPRLSMPSKEQIEGLQLDAGRAWLKRITKDAPMEVVVTGNFELAQGIEWASKYFGSLPARTETFEAIRAARKATYGAAGGDSRVELDTASPAAYVYQGWRGYEGRDVAKMCAAQMASDILSTRLLMKIREELGLVYSISAAYRQTAYDGLAHTFAAFSAAPDKLAQAADASRKTGLDYGETGPTDEEIKTAHKTLLNRLDADLQRAAYWSGALSSLALEENGLAKLKKRLACLRTPDQEAVRAAAKAIFQADRFFQVMTGPKGKLPAKPEADKPEDKKPEDDKPEDNKPGKPEDK